MGVRGPTRDPIPRLTEEQFYCCCTHATNGGKTLAAVYEVLVRGKTVAQAAFKANVALNSVSTRLYRLIERHNKLKKAYGTHTADQEAKP